MSNILNEKEVNYLNDLILNKLEYDYDFQEVVDFKKSNNSLYNDILNKLKGNKVLFSYKELDDEGNGFDFNIELWSEEDIIKGIGVFDEE